MIPLDDLDNFRNDLARTLRVYQRKIATDLKPRTLRVFANELDGRREDYEDRLSGDSAKALLKTSRKAVIDLNSSMEKLAGQLRNLASLVAAYKPPETSGELPGLSKDLAVLSESLDVVKKSIQEVIGKLEAARDVLSRPSGGSANRGGPRRRHYDLPDSLAAGAEDQW